MRTKMEYVVLRIYDYEEDSWMCLGEIDLGGDSTDFTQGQLKQKLIKWCVERNAPSGNYMIAYKGYTNIHCMDYPEYFKNWRG